MVRKCRNNMFPSLFHPYVSQPRWRISHGVDLNENGNVKEWKLIIHGYKKLHGGDLNENENYEKR